MSSVFSKVDARSSKFVIHYGRSLQSKFCFGKINDQILGRMDMKIIGLALIFLVACSFGLAQEKTETMGKSVHTMAGYLVDKACAMRMEKADTSKAMEKAKNHTKDCALQDACKASGYGIMSHGKFTPFDENGNKLAVEYFEKTDKENNIWVDVRGTMDGGTIQVVSIKDVVSKVKKDVKKKEAEQG